MNKKQPGKRALSALLTFLMLLAFLGALPLKALAKTVPALTIAPGPTIAMGGALSASALLADGLHPTGYISFHLYAPNTTSPPIYMETLPVTGNGAYATATGYTPTEPGTYNWVVTYFGDPDNEVAETAFGDAPQAAGRLSQTGFAFAPGSPTRKTFGDAPFDVTASGGQSGGGVTYAITSGPATVSGGRVTLTGVGTVIITATRAGDAAYLDATATLTIEVLPKEAEPCGPMGGIIFRVRVWKLVLAILSLGVLRSDDLMYLAISLWGEDASGIAELAYFKDLAGVADPARDIAEAQWKKTTECGLVLSAGVFEHFELYLRVTSNDGGVAYYSKGYRNS